MKHTIFCKKCDVELDENMKVCPLCGTSINSEEEKTDETKDVPSTLTKEDQYITDYNKLNTQEKRKLFWELSGIIILSGMIATLAINMIISKNIDWAKYCIIVLLCIFANITVITFLQERVFLLLSASFISNAALILFIDILSGDINWSVGLGLPMLFSFYLITAILIFLIKRTKQKSLNLFALFFIATGVFCLFIESIISYYQMNLVRLHWSVIVLVSIIPIASILFYIHYRLKRGVNLKRFFHI